MKRNIDKRILSFALVLIMAIGSVFVMSATNVTNCYAAGNSSFGPYPALPLGVNPDTDLIFIVDNRTSSQLIADGQVHMFVIPNGKSLGMQLYYSGQSAGTWAAFRSTSTPFTYTGRPYNPTTDVNWGVGGNVYNASVMEIAQANFSNAFGFIRFSNVNVYSNSSLTQVLYSANTWNVPIIDVTSQFAGKTITIQSKVSNEFLFAEKFYIQDAGDGWLAFIAPNWRYLTANDLLYSLNAPPVYVSSSILAEATCFRIYKQGSDYYIQSKVNEKYLEIPSDPLDWLSAPVKASAVEPSNESRLAIEETEPITRYVYLAGSTPWNANSTDDINAILGVFQNSDFLVESKLDPTFNELTGDFSDTSRRRLEADVLHFSGHACYENIALNASGTVGLKLGNTYQEFYGLSNVDFSKVQLVTFVGCETAVDGEGIPDNNIAYEAYLGGATCAVGWDATIHDFYGMFMDDWIERYYQKLLNGETVNDAIAYANSFSYPFSPGIKNAKVYGNGEIRIVNP